MTNKNDEFNSTMLAMQKSSLYNQLQNMINNAEAQEQADAKKIEESREKGEEMQMRLDLAIETFETASRMFYESAQNLETQQKVIQETVEKEIGENLQGFFDQQEKEYANKFEILNKLVDQANELIKRQEEAYAFYLKKVEEYNGKIREYDLLEKELRKEHDLAIDKLNQRAHELNKIVLGAR